MKGVLFRLFVRRSVLWDFLVVSVLARILSVMCVVVEQVWRGEARIGEAAYESGDALRIHLALLSGLVVGIVANFALQDLAYCRFSWTLPNLGKGLRRELSVLAGFVTLASALGFALFDGQLGFAAPPALSLLGFGFGTLLWDDSVGKRDGWLAQLAVLVMLCSAQSIAALLGEAPLIATPFALIVAPYAIWRSTAHGAMKARALVPADELGSSFREPATVAPYKPSQLRKVRGWTNGRLQGLKAWSRVVLFEDSGWVRGSWVWRSLRTSLFVAAATAALLFVLGLRRNGSAIDGLAWMAQAVFDPQIRPNDAVGAPPTLFVSLGFATGVFIMIQSCRQGLRRGVLYPLSRSDRAEIVWRAGLAQGLIAVLGLGAAFSLLGAIGWLASGTSLAMTRVPEVLASLTLAAVLVPGLQWVRLRFLEGPDESLSPTAYGTMIGISAGVFTGVHAFVIENLRRMEPQTATLLILVVLPLLAVATQGLYRAGIRSWFARADLA